jgi:uncharacterized protein YjiS (DUF1127 family)
MSCGSTTSNSTHTLGAASPSFPDLGWSWKIPFAWLAGIALAWDRRRQYRELLELNDHLLADIGVSRTSVEEVRRSSLYARASRDSSSQRMFRSVFRHGRGIVCVRAKRSRHDCH